ncbi:21773_t:CDS:2 [Cetraspora pellucida]|uniref:21773_t:CDS:1 n=1 Tax=Cetraspora pellucida TaxID=1433469 RepID=A0A9N9NQ48_9GLOM|nr:21773_t:CDS:2 [Cetraspora pellucida]
MFDKISVVITDNASSMNKAIRQLGTPHLGCTAHTIYLAVTDGLKQCKTLIGLLELRELILELATNLTNNPDRTIHADGNNLNEKILTDEE